MKINRAKNIEEFFHFNDIEPKHMEYYVMAFTHPSKINNSKNHENYERIEFLGDSIIQFLSSNYIYKNFPDLDQGTMTNLRARAVCTDTLSQLSQQIGLPRLLKTSSGQAESDAKTSSKVQADIFESVTGAIYLDLGLEKAQQFVSKYVFHVIDNIHNNNNKDVKSQLQEHFQTFSRENIHYQTSQLDDKKFLAKAIHNKVVYGQGIGHTKKEAEMQAAKDALAKLNV